VRTKARDEEPGEEPREDAEPQPAEEPGEDTEPQPGPEPPTRANPGPPTYRRDQIHIVIDLMTFLPPVPPGHPIESILKHLGISRRAFFRLLANLRLSQVRIEAAALPRELHGKLGYYLAGVGPELLRKLRL
jgi:hypothetical protein